MQSLANTVYLIWYPPLAQRWLKDFNWTNRVRCHELLPGQWMTTTARTMRFSILDGLSHVDCDVKWITQRKYLHICSGKHDWSRRQLWPFYRDYFISMIKVFRLAEELISTVCCASPHLLLYQSSIKIVTVDSECKICHRHESDFCIWLWCVMPETSKCDVTRYNVSPPADRACMTIRITTAKSWPESMRQNLSRAGRSNFGDSLETLFP